MVSLSTTRSGARAAARAAGAAAPAPRVDWKGASSAHSYDPFGRHVASRPSRREERHAHFSNPKYFKSAPQHSYVHQWTPTINERTGQDNEVDPFDRIAKRGHYAEMLRNWEPYYSIDNLLRSKGAPTEMLRVAQDLSRHGVRLGDSASAKLLWSVVNKVEGLVKQQQGEQVLLGPGGERAAAVAGMSLTTLRNTLMNAKLLIDEIRSGHTVGLETGAALALLHGIGGGAAMAEDLEVELRHLLEDPETPLLNKKNFYEAMALVPVLDWSGAGAEKGAAEVAARRSFHWLGRMKALRIRPGSDFFKSLLYQFVRRGDVTRALEVKKNMMDPDGFLVEPKAPHYFQLLVGLSQAGEVELFTKMQLEMKQHSLPYSTQTIWGLFMHAVAKKGDVPHLLSTYKTLKSGVKLLMVTRRNRNRRKQKLQQVVGKRNVRANASIIRSVLQGMRSQGMIEEMHRFWREETLTVTGWAYQTAAIRRGKNVGFSEPVLIELCTALAQAKRYDLLADVYDVAYPKTLSVSVWEKKNDPFYLDLKLGIPRNYVRHEADVRNGRIWHCMSVGLAMVGRMEESHFVASKLMGVRDTRTFGVEHHMHLLEGALRLPKQEEKEYFVGITLKALEYRGYPLNGDAYALVMACFLDGGDAESAMRVLSEMTAQAVFPAPEKASVLLQRLPDAATAERKVLLEGLWSAASRARQPLPHPVVSLFAERHPRLPGLSDALLHSIEAFESFRPNPAGLRLVGGRPRLLVADGTVAVSLLDAEVDGDVVVLQSVLSQLQAALHRSDASEKEQAFFRTSLYAFRQFVDGAATGPEEEVRAAAQVVTHEGEHAAGVDHAHATPQRIVEIAKVLAATDAGREVAVLTNDTEMAAFCRSRGVEVQLLNRASQEYLPSPDDVPELPAAASSRVLLPLSDTDAI